VAELKKMKQEDGDKKLKISDAAKVVAAKWKQMTEDEKQKWKRDKAAEDAEGSSSVVLGITGMGAASGASMHIMSGAVPGVVQMGGPHSAMSAVHPVHPQPQPPAPPPDPVPGPPPPTTMSAAPSMAVPQPPPPAK